MRPLWTFRAVHLAVVASTTLAACGGPDRAPSTGAAPTDLTGAGATFPFPVFRAWIAEYASREGIRINYMSVGSAEGLRLLAAGEVDFGTTDREPSAADLGAPSCPRIAVPLLVGAIAVVYRLDVAEPLRLDRATLRNIFDGRVSRWNSPEIQRLNPGIALPATAITVVHRGAGSATGRLFANYIAGVAAASDTAASDPVWPVGIGAEGNEGVAAQVQLTRGAIGYVELAYVGPSGLAVALIQNGAGEYSRPTAATVNATAAAALVGRRDAHGVSLIALPDSGTYPIAAVTWLAIDPARLGAEKGLKVAEFARWALRDGAQSASRLEYSPLPPAIVSHYDSVLAGLKFLPCPAG